MGRNVTFLRVNGWNGEKYSFPLLLSAFALQSTRRELLTVLKFPFRVRTPTTRASSLLTTVRRKARLNAPAVVSHSVRTIFIRSSILRMMANSRMELTAKHSRRLGDLLLPNRVVMAPLTRGRARLSSILGAMPEGRRMSLRHQSEGSAACASAAFNAAERRNRFPPSVTRTAKEPLNPLDWVSRRQKRNRGS